MYIRQFARFAVRPTPSVMPAALGVSSTRCLATKATSSKSKTKPAAKEKKEKSKEKPKPEPVKIEKDHLPPSRPPSSFAKYLMENRSVFLSQPNVGAVTKVLAAQWHQMSAQEKKQYEPTTEQWEEYHQRTLEWKENVPPKILKEINRRRKAKGMKLFNSRTRTRPISSYFLFLRDYRESRPTLEVEATGPERMIQMSRQAAEKWRSLSDSERQAYNDKAAALRKEFKESLAQESTSNA